MNRLIFLLMLLLPISAYSIPADVDVCFTPGERCDMQIISAIDNAQHEIMVQAYQLTSAPIAGALVNAHRRGVVVKVILDKSQARKKGYSSAIFLNHMQIPVWIDQKAAIAHNKVMIIDDATVITGSYNFSKAAQMRNAENMLVIKSKDIADLYLANFKKRLNASTVLADY